MPYAPFIYYESSKNRQAGLVLYLINTTLP
jgi:hypothetical protein